MNTVKLTGRISKFERTHEVKGTPMYEGIVEVSRTSGTVDSIPFITSNSHIGIGKMATMYGEISTHNYQSVDGKNHKKMYAKIAAPYVFDTDHTDWEYENEVELQGYLVKKEKVRCTPMGKVIVDFVLAINTPYGKSYYPSCITWGTAAQFLSDCNIGDEIHIKGRFQSRNYTKQIPCRYEGDVCIEEEKEEVRTAYEISVKTLEKV